MGSQYEILRETPTLAEYKYLCLVAGLDNEINFNVAERSLKNSIFAVTVKSRDKVIGMGRIVGDGAMYFYIQDVIVHPGYRRLGMGKEIMNTLVEYLKENAPDKASVGLFISKGKENFYEKCDFKDATPHTKGIFTVIKRCD
ncbi:GNAT family N-acetyltransferase [Ectobacillus funiculus]|uniref:GNAT family N-acetyltransferase n=1 Tax=Ectobacillus funiculus TaxID=137993 RepID=UPI00101D3F92|nr:GNAT family N-acetyltransferase [Ectobacillus funiculus]